MIGRQRRGGGIVANINRRAAGAEGEGLRRAAVVGEGREVRIRTRDDRPGERAGVSAAGGVGLDQVADAGEGVIAFEVLDCGEVRRTADSVGQDRVVEC